MNQQIRINKIARKVMAKSIIAAVTADFVQQLLYQYGLNDKLDVFFQLTTAIQSLRSNLALNENVAQKKKGWFKKLFSKEPFHAEDMEVSMLTAIMQDDFDLVAYNVGIYRTFREEVQTEIDNFNASGSTDPSVYKQVSTQSKRFMKLSNKIDGIVDKAASSIETIINRCDTSTIKRALRKDLGENYANLVNDDKIEANIDSILQACISIRDEIQEYMYELPQLKQDIINLDNTIKSTPIPSTSNSSTATNIADHADTYNNFTGDIKFKKINATVSNATFTINNDNTINWNDGTWESGTWKDGTWKDGTWEDGIWEDGTWESGTWKKGTWKDGTWNDGTWKDGAWEDGIWENGTWKKGTWKDGTWNDGTWEKGTWKDGTWENGTWKKGTWKKGTWKSGIDANGVSKTDSPDRWATP